MSPVPTAFMPARVAEIQQRFAPQRSSASTSTNSSAFDSVLSSALGLDASTGASALAAASMSQPSGGDVVSAAMNYLGVPYKWGGTDPDTGLDCSGFVQQVYEDLGIDVPRVSRDQAQAGTAVASLAEAKPGDLVAFGSPVDHIGIYLGNNKMVHAPHTGEVVKVAEITRPIASIRRIVTGPAINTPLDATFGTNSAISAFGLNPQVAQVATAASTAASSTGITGAEPFDALFAAAGQKYGFNPRLLAAIAKTESNFNPNATSPVGATGLMQFMPATARGLGIDPTNPAQAVDGAAKYLRQQYDRFGSIELALAAYNAGPGNVSKYGGVPPFTETNNYVSKVTGLLNGQSPLASSLAA